MNDRAVSLLEQYDVGEVRTRKGRGAILCDTDRGCFIFREYKGNPDKLLLQNALLNRIQEKGDVCAESIIPARSGELFVKDNDGTPYILKTYMEGRECNIYDRTECLEAVRVLAKLHRSLEPGKASVYGFSPEREYEKHNRELKKVRQYLRKKGQKVWFEISLQQSLDYFLEQAEQVTSEWSAYSHLTASQPESRLYCHGDYQYHNIIRRGNGWCVINFEKCIQDNPVRDICLFLRKLLEKNDWSVELGKELLDAYNEILPMSAYSRIDLYYRLAYPEKFWKIVNFYFNSGKAWIPMRNMEKLKKLLDQEEAKQQFLDEVFRKV